MRSSTQQPSLARGVEAQPNRAATDPALHRKRVRLAITLAFALLIWFLPPPGDLSVQAWRLFAIFGATILSVMIGAIRRALPAGGLDGGGGGCHAGA